MHQSAEQAAKLGREGKPESYYFPPQLNWTGNNFPHTFMGLEPGTTKDDLRKCLERWNEGDNGILDLSKAYRLKPGTGWLIPPCVLHAPGSLVTYEPQWGSDVFGMYQSMVEGRRVPWDLLVKDVPEDKHRDLDYLVEQLDWEKNVDPEFKAHNYLEPIVHAGSEGEGYVDKWIVYGTVDGKQLFSARELTVFPGGSATIKDAGAYGLVAVQGRGTIGKLEVDTPVFIRYGEVTKDEVFVADKRAKEGVTFKNTGTEPFVSLRYFGPGRAQDLPKVGDHSQGSMRGEAMSATVLPAKTSGDDRVVIIPRLTWDAYAAIGDAIPDPRGLRMVFVEGRLTFLTVSRRHEWYAEAIAELFKAVVLGCGIDWAGSGSATYRLRRKRPGSRVTRCITSATTPGSCKDRSTLT